MKLKSPVIVDQNATVKK